MVEGYNGYVGCVRGGTRLAVHMKVVAINCGSSSLKFSLMETSGEAADARQERRLAEGSIQRIGSGPGRVRFYREGAQSLEETASMGSHGEAALRVIQWLDSLGLLGHGGVEAFGHRVVHGGDRLAQPAIISQPVIEAIEDVSELAPLHNGPSLAAVRAARAALGPDFPMVAVFDTAFHHGLPEHVGQYALPYWLAQRHRIRRYGFHGIAHRYMVERYSAISGPQAAATSLVTLQLGNGCSATAVKEGRSMDTSMGFTPLEGLMMGTRSGDLDPALVVALARKEGASMEEVEDWLNTRSGLLGVSGRSADMRELLDAEARGDRRAALAIEMFCYRARKYIGAYMAALGGADAILFGGGIGENAPAIRARICQGMEWCGLVLDAGRNAAMVGREGRISAGAATVHAYVIRVDEELLIARDTARTLAAARQASSPGGV